MLVPTHQSGNLYFLPFCKGSVYSLQQEISILGFKYKNRIYRHFFASDEDHYKNFRCSNHKSRANASRRMTKRGKLNRIMS